MLQSVTTDSKKVRQFANPTFNLPFQVQKRMKIITAGAVFRQRCATFRASAGVHKLSSQ
jgi:hypothetical protein